METSSRLLLSGQGSGAKHGTLGKVLHLPGPLISHLRSGDKNPTS